MTDSYSDGEIAGIVIGCLIGIPLVIFLILFALRMWMRGPTKGSDNTKKLDGKLVVITGKLSFDSWWLNLNRLFWSHLLNMHEIIVRQPIYVKS